MEEYEDGREVPCWKIIKEVGESGVVRQEKKGKMMLHSEGAFVQERGERSHKSKKKKHHLLSRGYHKERGNSTELFCDPFAINAWALILGSYGSMYVQRQTQIVYY
jgi:hypothetical protein